MNKAIEVKLSCQIKAQFKSSDSVLLFLLASKNKHIKICHQFLDKWIELEYIPFTCELDATKFADAVTAWLKQNVLEWSQI